MSQYQKTPFKSPNALAVAGTPQYLLGSWNDRTGPTAGFLISDASNGTTLGTYVFQIQSGNIPVTGSLMSVVGAGNSVNFNITNVPITFISCTEQGVCTVSATITSTATPTTQTQDFGSVQILQPEVGESVTGTYSSVPITIPFNNPEMQEGKSISASVNLLTGGSLSGVTIVLQAANIDLDSEYTTIYSFTAAGASGNLYTFQSGQGTPATPGTADPGGVNILNWRFFRFQISGGTGTGLAVAKFEI
jgi:hypothetical protein